MNRESFQKIKDHIHANPKRVDMEVYIDHKADGGDLCELSEIAIRVRDRDDYYPDCGTVGCIAGWAAVLMGKAGPSIRHSGICDIKDTAMRALDITLAQAERLFYVAAWPKDLQNAYNSAVNGNLVVRRGVYVRETDRREVADIVIQAIDRFVATDGKW